MKYVSVYASLNPSCRNPIENHSISGKKEFMHFFKFGMQGYVYWDFPTKEHTLKNKILYENRMISRCEFASNRK